MYVASPMWGQGARRTLGNANLVNLPLPPLERDVTFEPILLLDLILSPQLAGASSKSWF